jgi:hypothetical protein
MFLAGFFSALSDNIVKDPLNVPTISGLMPSREEADSSPARERSPVYFNVSRLRA